MRIQEILDLPRSSPISSDPDQDPEFTPDPTITTVGGQRLGQGAQARVVTLAPDEQRVSKQILQRDPAYVRFVGSILALQGRGIYNPWLPRIDHDPEAPAGRRGRYRLEQLFPLDSGAVSDAQVWAMLTHCLSERDPIMRLRTDGEYRLGKFLGLCENIILGVESLERVRRDPQLVRALALLRSVSASNSNFHLDLHLGNIMMRLTPLHLVFVDPVQYKRLNRFSLLDQLIQAWRKFAG